MGPSILLGAPGRDQDRPGGAQLILLALTGELDSKAFFFFFYNGDQANSIALRISPLAKNLGLGGEGKASGK